MKINIHAQRKFPVLQSWEKGTENRWHWTGRGGTKWPPETLCRALFSAFYVTKIHLWSQRVVGFIRDLWRSSSPVHLLKQCQFILQLPCLVRPLGSYFFLISWRGKYPSWFLQFFLELIFYLLHLSPSNLNNSKFCVCLCTGIPMKRTVDFHNPCTWVTSLNSWVWSNSIADGDRKFIKVLSRV